MQTATNPQTGEKLVLQNGQWVPMNGAAQAPQAPQPMTVGTPRVDPFKVSAEQRAVEDQGFQRQKFAAEMELKERELAQGPKSDASAKSRTDAITGYKAAQSIRRLVADMRQKFEAGPGSTSGPIGIVDYFPTEANKAFDAAGNSTRGFVGQALGFTGGQLNSVQEAEMAIGPYLPSASDYDQVALDKMQRLEALANDAESRAIAILGGRPDENGRLTPIEAPRAEQLDGSTNAATLVSGDNGDGDRMTAATGGYQTVNDPKLAGVRGEYLKRLGSGQSASEIIAYLRSAGITDPRLLKTAVDQVKFRRANPKVPLSNYNTSELDDMDVPLSGIESTMNSAAQSAPGAYAMRAGNAVTANNLDSIVGATGGNAERARLALDYAEQSSPTASLAGDISGGVIAALTGEAGLARAGMASGLPRALIADVGYGSASGAGAADTGNRGTAAINGALYAGAGSLGGNALMRGAGSIISPTGGNVNALYGAGVRPTPGQRLVNAGDGKGAAGMIGKAVNATEEQLSSVPIVGSAIRGARQDARDQFQVGAFNQALGELGMKLPKGTGPGKGAHAFTQQAFDRAYNKAREGLRVVADEELSNQLSELSSQVANLAEPSAKRFNTLLQNLVIRRASGPELSGKDFKQVQVDLGKTIRGIRKSQSGDGELADALEDLQHILDGAARRHSDPAAVELLDQADRGYAKFVRIEDASKRGGAGKDAGSFSPTDFAAAVKNAETRVRSKAYSQGAALMQDYAEQGLNLADRVPNSGSPERLMAAGGLAGGAYMVEPGTASLLGALTLAYAPGVRKATTAAMAPRGPKAKAVGEKVKKSARIVGATGALLGSQSSGDR